MALKWKSETVFYGQSEKWDCEIYPDDTGTFTLRMISRVNSEFTEAITGCASVEEAQGYAEAYIVNYPYGTFKEAPKPKNKFR